MLYVKELQLFWPDKKLFLEKEKNTIYEFLFFDKKQHSFLHNSIAPDFMFACHVYLYHVQINVHLTII